jgi:hypothetical protein
MKYQQGGNHPNSDARSQMKIVSEEESSSTQLPPLSVYDMSPDMKSLSSFDAKDRRFVASPHVLKWSNE